jgi:energy-coupling factor transporter transmembrane protein EcfT
MPHHLDLYVKTRSPLHRLDPRAKMLAAAGFIAAVLLARMHPSWSMGALLVLLICAAALARIPVQLICRRLLSLAAVIGMPFLLSRLGGEATRAAGEQFAAKSLLVAAAFLVLMASTRAVVLLEVAERLPLVSVFGQLGEFILRGVDLLAEEVMRTNRAWALRAPRATLGVRLSGLTQASMSLIARAAARSERIGAAMVLRGFQGKLPMATPAPLLWSHVAAGVAFALASLCIAGLGRWR